MTPPTLTRVPNKPKTPMHSFRVSHELWEAAKAEAEASGSTITAELRKTCERLAKRGSKR